MENLIQDIRYSTRMLLKKRGFTAVAIITLALGIGANSAIFSVINGVLLRPLPYQDPDRFVLLKNAPTFRQMKEQIEVSDIIDWQDRVHSFEMIATVGAVGGGLNLSGDPEPIRIQAAEVSQNFFTTVGVKEIYGRSFLPDETESGNPNVAVISHGLWQRRFGGDPAILDQTIMLNGVSFAVIGVTPPEYNYPKSTDVWIPITFKDRAITNSVIAFDVLARLKPDISLEQAQAEMRDFFETLKSEDPSFALGRRTTFEVIPMKEQLVQGIRPALLVLFGAVAFVLLIACANVTNLLLARAAARRREIAIRGAMGASRGRLIRQLLTESIILSLLGGALGLLLAMWGIDLLVALSPEELPRIEEVKLDRWVLAFTFGVAALTGILFGLAPAIQSSRVDINEALKEGSSKVKTGFGSRSLRSLLIVSEVALALVLLIGAGLLIKSFIKIREVHPGFNAENVLSLSLDLPGSKYGKSNQKTEFYNQAIERIGALPGVQSVGASSAIPFASETHGFQFSIEGEPQGFNEKRIATYATVTNDYFRAMGIPLLAGRYFTPEDKKESTPVVIVTQSLAQSAWPNESAVGKKIVIIGKQSREIVGVVGDVKSAKLEGDIRSGIYAPHTQSFFTLTTMAIRTASDPTNMIASVRGEIQAIDKDLPLYDIKTMEQRLSDVVAERRFTLMLLGTFAALALTLAAIGIYGVMSYSVSQRTREIGIRMALGARRIDVLKLILLRGLALTVVGVGVGLGAAYAVTRIMSSLLYEVSTTDTWTFIVVALVLGVVATAATLIPARRATRVDPMVALRYE